MHEDENAQTVIVERRGTAGLIRLNRPKALNSLTLPMIEAIDTALEAFANDPAIASVTISGEGERGLCAGGDIRALYQSGRNGSGLAEEFWRREFLLNHRIAFFPKPYVAFMDGITMGGGVGLSAHGRYRIVTERTRLAMPETGIGYFPDVGATWLLARAPGELGIWIGLTGLELNAADAIQAGLSDFEMSSFQYDELIDTLAELPKAASGRDVEAVIKNFARETSHSDLRSNIDLINRTMRFGKIEEIIGALAAEEGDFASRTHEAIAKRSPTSVKLTLELLRRGKQSRTLMECLEREFSACLAILGIQDFYEGIRAAVIDKDRMPKWQPSSFDKVEPEALAAFFKPADQPLFSKEPTQE
ncbi:enoyl-CoA hydratase/isomerase family protein [Oryzifoliimicrobium ureilyticus]|uniref:enoyl-CoA hydratase/isomerase family protein n=1 Tax=Oryzifoliimicrobium ureilyticus TaxID=3113724 RepID=UPI00307622A1